MSSVCSGLEGLRTAVRLCLGDSKSPYRGRSGRSGVTLPLLCSETDVERALLVVVITLLSAPSSLSLNTIGPGDLAVVYNEMIDSLTLRLCIWGTVCVFSEKSMNRSPNLT